MQNARYALLLLAAGAAPISAVAQASCAKPVYLSFDTGHMGVAPLVAEVLKRQEVRVTFFGAAERTLSGGDSLDNQWAPWWKARAAEGHEFASHTYDHAYWRGDVKGLAPRFRIAPSAGAFAGRQFTWDAEQYCANITKASERLQYVTGKKPLPVFRAPGARLRPGCWRPPGPAAMRTWAGRRPASWATSCRARSSATRSCCNRPSITSSPATS